VAEAIIESSTGISMANAPFWVESSKALQVLYFAYSMLRQPQPMH